MLSTVFTVLLPQLLFTAVPAIALDLLSKAAPAAVICCTCRVHCAILPRVERERNPAACTRMKRCNTAQCSVLFIRMNVPAGIHTEFHSGLHVFASNCLLGVQASVETPARQACFSSKLHSSLIHSFSHSKPSHHSFSAASSSTSSCAWHRTALGTNAQLVTRSPYYCVACVRPIRTPCCHLSRQCCLPQCAMGPACRLHTIRGGSRPADRI